VLLRERAAIGVRVSGGTLCPAVPPVPSVRVS